MSALAESIEPEHPLSHAPVGFEQTRNADGAHGVIGGTRPTSRPVCRHCGAPLLDARTKESGFCCAGCAYVYRLVQEHGLESYYRIKDDVTAPADAAVFQARDYAWLEAEQREAEAGTVAPTSQASASGAASPSGIPELTLGVQGISCAGCVWLIERVFQQQAGARDIFVNAQFGSMRLRWQRGKFSAAEFARRLQAFGYLAGPAGQNAAEPQSRGLVKRIGLCTAFAMNVMLFTLPTYFGMEPSFEYAPLFGMLSLVFATLSLLVGGSFFLTRAWQSMREKTLQLDLPIAIGIIGAYLGSLYGWFAGKEHFLYFDFVSAFIVLMLVGRWAQVAAVERNQRRLLSVQPRPPSVKLADGRRVSPESLRGQETLCIASGHVVPVEARLETAKAEFSLASINGESQPRLFSPGQRVPSGAVNVGRGEAELEALQGWSESLLAQLTAPAEVQGSRHAFLEKIVRGYLAGILIVAVLAGVGWWLATGDALRTWAVVTATLVVSCPCAIGLAFPLADEMATVAARVRGVFVRRGDLWATLGGVRRVVFDKTGTLTLETPQLQNPEALRALSSEERAALLALVCDQPHPVSRCLAEILLAEFGNETPGGVVVETVGFGVERGDWSLGRSGWRDDAPLGDETIFAHAGRVIARFNFAEAVRADARAEVDALRARGLEVHILSGDAKSKVDTLAGVLGLPQSHAVGEMSPQEKAAWFEGCGAADALMLGDGANDSLAFDRALCRGTPVVHRGVLERKADFYYLGGGIGGIRALFEIDTVRRRTHRVILTFSIVYNLCAVGLAVAGRMNPLVAAALMPVNSLLTLTLVTASMHSVMLNRNPRAVRTRVVVPAPTVDDQP